jgi:hypothetical protein
MVLAMGAKTRNAGISSRRIICKLRGERYRNPGNEWLAKFIQEELFTFDYAETAAWYAETARKLSPLTGELALLGCNDRYFLDRLARAPGRRTPLAVRPLPRGRAQPGRLYRSARMVRPKRSIDGDPVMRN